MNRFSPRHLSAFFRRTSPLDRIALAIIFIYTVMRLAGLFGLAIPLTGFAGFLSFLALAFLLVRMIPWFRTKFMWTLRNRLLVAYVFIAVVPVILLLTMVGVASYLLYLEMGAHLLHDDLEERVSIIAAQSESIANALAHEVDEGKAPVVDDSILREPGLAQSIMAAKTYWPDLRVRLNAGQHLLQAGNGLRFSGLAEHENRLWFAAAEKRQTNKGSFTLVVSAPVTPELLDGFTSELGPIEVVLWRPATPSDAAGGLRYTNAERSYVAGQRILSRTRTLSASTGLLDFKVSGLSVFEATYMEDGKEAGTVPVLASFSLRPSALNRRLFTTVGAIGPLLISVLLAVGVVFLLIEIAALATGVVMTRTITRAVNDLYEATLRVRRGDFGPRIRVHQRDQLGALGGSFNEMTSSISELIEEQSKRQKLENEIVIAREVQSQLFPQVLPSVPGLQLAAICRPARVVSGDYYDFILTGKDCVGIALADISGKGIFAALLMASLQATLRSQAMLDTNCGTAELVQRLNRHLFRNTSDDRYATFFYAVYDANDRTLTYTNAGHLGPFLVEGDTVKELTEGGTVVGLFEEYPYTQQTIHVEPGSLLVAFSDGLTEPENVYGEEYGSQRLKEEIMRQRANVPDRIAENLIAAAEQWAGSPEQADDITVVVARMG
ncbi:MAG TPA: SpoIIE family protein phosphatase [Candidatus Acidoferrales bacterium]